MYIGGSRLILQDIYQERQKSKLDRQRVLVYGAGSAGVQLANALQSGHEFLPVAFIDDKRELQKHYINGMKVIRIDHGDNKVGPL